MSTSKVWVALIGIALIAGACSGGDSGASADKPGILAPNVSGAPADPGAAPTPTPVPEGRTVNQYDLEVSWCFNTYELYSEQLDETSELTTEVDCLRPHDGEVYATYFHPADGSTPYPGTPEMERWANINCHAGFETFVGRPFEESELYIATIRPTEETWLEGPHREVICYVFALDAQLIGPMGNTQI